MTEKILFAAPFGADVSTAVKNISDIATTVKKETIKSTDGSDLTIEMEHGALQLDTNDRIDLYGILGQNTIQQAHETLSKNCIGVILLIDHTGAEPIESMLQNIEHYQSLVGEEAIAVGLTNYDNTLKLDINEFHVTLREKNLHIPVFSINIHDKHNIITLIKAMLYNLDSGIN